jgi:hypothetical protein
MLAGLQTPFRLLVLEQANRGSSAARNHGAARAGGQVLVFMDDDMETCSSFLSAHARPHFGRDDVVVLGYFEAEMGGSASYFADQLRSWWGAMYRHVCAPGHRYAYTDLMGGNFSVARRLFDRAGGFDVRLIRHMDYELAVRLLAAGAEMIFARAAATVHHERSSLRKTLEGKKYEGMDDVLQGRLHPDLKPFLPLAKLRAFLALPSRLMMRLAFALPWLGDRLAAICKAGLGPLERVRCYRIWLSVVTGLNIYWYWRGVATELGSLDKLGEFLIPSDAARKVAPEAAVRLEQGVAVAAAYLDATRPAAAALYYADRLVGHIPALPGTEALAGRHLAPLLAEVFRAPLLHALAGTRPTGIPLLDDRLAELAEHYMRAWKEPQWRV